MPDRAAIFASRNLRLGARGGAAPWLLLLLLCSSEPLLATDLGGAAVPPLEPNLPGDPAMQWLDEVRAQRKAVEEHRRAAREAIDARRRLNDPWGTAQKEAREEDLRRRRQARLERIEQEREIFRNLTPPQPPEPWPPVPELQPPLDTAAGDEQAPFPPAPPAAFPPPGWDNYWYYRGY